MSELQRFQHAFARHLRDPRRTPRPVGVPARRMAVYTELVFNNVSGFLDRCFPVGRSLLGEPRWRRLQRRFWREAALHSPLHREIPQAFVHWLRQGGAVGLPRWYAALAHYEWAELAVDLMVVQTPAHRPDGALMQQPVALNPALLNLAYDWPVQRIGPHYRPRRPQPTQLLVWRDAADSVQFMQLNPVTARLLALLAERAQTGEQACRAIAAELRHPDPTQLLAHGAALLAQWHACGVVLGTHA